MMRMKVICTLLLTTLLVHGCDRFDRNRVKADTKKSELTGSIKAVRSETVILVDGMGKPSPEQMGIAEESGYDLDGFETEKLFYNPDKSLLSRTAYARDARSVRSEAVLYDPKGTMREKKIFKADERGNIIEWQNTRPDGSVHSKSSYSYDERGNNTEWVIQNSRGAVTDKWVYGYDDRGRVIEESRYYADGTLDMKHVHAFDEKGLRKESETYKADGALVETQRYDYEFDSTGNWIKKTTSRLLAGTGTEAFVPVSITFRTISYY